MHHDCHCMLWRAEALRVTVVASWAGAMDSRCPCCRSAAIGTCE
jgi:hypothetical protein